MSFWQFCWDIVKFEVMGLFIEFCYLGLFVLIPEKGGASRGFKYSDVVWMQMANSIQATQFAF